MGLSTSGSISLGWALVAGRKRVPSPAAGKTALQTFMLIKLSWLLVFWNLMLALLAKVDSRLRRGTGFYKSDDQLRVNSFRCRLAPPRPRVDQAITSGSNVARMAPPVMAGSCLLLVSGRSLLESQVPEDNATPVPWKQGPVLPPA